MTAEVASVHAQAKKRIERAVFASMERVKKIKRDGSDRIKAAVASNEKGLAQLHAVEHDIDAAKVAARIEQGRLTRMLLELRTNYSRALFRLNWLHEQAVANATSHVEASVSSLQAALHARIAAMEVSSSLGASPCEVRPFTPILYT